MRIMKTDGTWTYVITDGSFNSILAELEKNVDESILIQNGEYHWIGIIMQFGETIRLKVKSIQPI